jgi:hypothetical protein
VDPDLAKAITEASEQFNGVSVNGALMFHEGGASLDDVAEYFAKWTLRPLDEARKSVRFISDPTWRAYTITYDAGLELCRKYIGGDPAKVRRLLTEHVRIGELVSA